MTLSEFVKRHNQVKPKNLNYKTLTMAERERLAILAEECAEVIKVCSKIQRHGFRPIVGCCGITYNNRSDLECELGDVREAMQRMVKAGDISESKIRKQARVKAKTRKQFLHYQ